MPMDEPARAGLTISGSPSLATTAHQSVLSSTTSYCGVGIPLAIQTSLVRHLSIASADAITPLPVYGIPRTSSAPWMVPSSPKRPWSALKTLWKPSGRNSHSDRSAGSKAWASTPLLLSAASTALPDKKEISLSEDGPPINTATFPHALMRFPRSAPTHNADGRLLRPPAPAAPQHRVGLAHPSTPQPFRTRSCDS